MFSKLVCIDCETEVVDSNSKRGYKFCPNCTTTRNRRSVEKVFLKCNCCHTELSRDEDSVAARKEAHKSRIKEMSEKHTDEEGSGIESVDGISEYIDRSSISPQNMCVDCLEAGCRLDVRGCLHRIKNTDPDECTHDFVERVYQEDSCRWCGVDKNAI